MSQYASASESASSMVDPKNLNLVEISGMKYKVAMFVVVGINVSEKEFGEITTVFNINNKLYFDINIHKQLTFNKHSHSYIIEKVPDQQNRSNLVTDQNILRVFV